jgi:hypothetical protein
VLATASVCFFYIACQREDGRAWPERLKYLPLLMSLGIGLAINNARAVAEALFNHQSGFTRTPKTGAEGKVLGQPVKKSYRGKRDFLPAIEVAFGLYFTLAVGYAIYTKIFTSLPFLILFQMGFLYVGLSSIFQQRAYRATRISAAPASTEERRAA